MKYISTIVSSVWHVPLHGVSTFLGWYQPELWEFNQITLIYFFDEVLIAF